MDRTDILFSIKLGDDDNRKVYKYHIYLTKEQEKKYKDIRMQLLCL